MGEKKTYVIVGYILGVSDIIIYMITSDYGSRSGSIIYDSTWEHLPQESSTSLEESWRFCPQDLSQVVAEAFVVGKRRQMARSDVNLKGWSMVEVKYAILYYDSSWKLMTNVNS